MNHWQRIEAAIAGEATDVVPVALWRHFPGDDLDPDRLAAHMLAWQRRWDFDLVKFMPPGTYGVVDWGAGTEYRGNAIGTREVVAPAVERTEDWARIGPLDHRAGSWGRQNDALRTTARALGGAVPILQTVFSPLTTARKLATDRLFADLRCHPDALHRALRAITDVTIAFALDALDAGAHGIFLATQLATWRLLATDEYRQFGKAYDLEILRALAGRSRLNMLHAHGDDVMFDLLADYPVEMLNWHDRLTPPAIAAAATRFPRLLVGGLNEHGTLLSGGPDAIRAEVADAICQSGGRRLMIGPGCVLPIATRERSIQAVVDAVRNPGSGDLAAPA
jgi:uroporphyrinogen decarboxylase